MYRRDIILVFLQVFHTSTIGYYCIFIRTEFSSRKAIIRSLECNLIISVGTWLDNILLYYLYQGILDNIKNTIKENIMFGIHQIWKLSEVFALLSTSVKTSNLGTSFYNKYSFRGPTYPPPTSLTDCVMKLAHALALGKHEQNKMP